MGRSKGGIPANKHTQEQADLLDKAIGAIPIGQYLGNKVPREYQCVVCGDIYKYRPYCLRRWNAIYCKKCSKKIQSEKTRTPIEKVKQVCLSHNIIPIFTQYIDNKTPLDLKCKCGNTFQTTYDSINCQNVNSCGHCNDPILGYKYNKLTPIIIFPDRKGCSVVCECECGKITRIMYGNELVTKIRPIKSCGHCNDPSIGDKNNALTIRDVKTILQGGCRVKCECDCGNTKWMFGNQFITGAIKTCGHCKLNRNGRATSYTALDLHNLIEQITSLDWEHNYHIKGAGCVDMANTKQKIAIEYNSYYNHMIRNGDRSKYDNEKIKKLRNLGWKVCIIKSSGRDIPSSKIISNILNDLQNGAKQRTLTMNSYKKAHRKWCKNVG